MELSSQIRQHRTRLGMSQEDLASRVFVSRQTVSNWETDKTYPDVQSLLLLSDLFEVPIDELVRGDVMLMEKRIAEEAQKMKVLSWVMACFLLALAVGALPCLDAFGLPGCLAYVAVTFVPALLASIGIERIKRKNDLVAYREISAFMAGEAPEDIKRVASRDRKSLVIRTVAMAAAAALVASVIVLAVSFILP